MRKTELENAMNIEDPKLSGLLQQWPDIEPRPAFTQDVLRRIRLEITQPRPAGWWALLPAWLGSGRHLAGAAAATMVFTFAVGVFATLILSSPINHRTTEAMTGFSILTPGTIAGNYVAMTGDR